MLRKKNQKVGKNQKLKGFAKKNSNCWNESNMIKVELFAYN